jgi:hypothetical protein
VARGRVYFVSTTSLYAIGKKGPMGPAMRYQPEPAPVLVPEENPVNHVQITPDEVIMRPGQAVKFTVRAFNEKGEFIYEPKGVITAEGLKGTFNAAGAFVADAANVAQTGAMTFTLNGIKGQARVRVVPPLPWSEDFESIAVGQVPKHWTNTQGKYVVREMEGKKVLAKLADNAFTKRARVFIGAGNQSNYTVEVDVNATERRRQMGDGGVVAQRYQLAIFGNHQRLELQAWQPETERTALVEFPWKKDTWYRLKLEVQNLPDGKVRARGKAWPAAEPEPDKWLVERIDPLGNKEGAPGIYADAPFEVFFDNFKVTPNTPMAAPAKPTPAAKGTKK